MKKTEEDEMSNRDTEELHREIAAFIERYAPRSSLGRDFERDLRMLLSLTFQEAQRPFVWELNKYRDSALTSSLLKPMTATEISQKNAKS